MNTRNAAPWRQWLRIAYLLLVGVAFCYALYAQRDEFAKGLQVLGFERIMWSTVLATAGIGCSGLIWYVIIQGLGANLSLAAGARMFFITQLGKYMPGSLWPVLMQADFAKMHDIPVRVAVMAQVLFMWVYVITAGIVAVPIWFECLSEFANIDINPWAMLLSPFLLVLLHPRITQLVLNWILARLKRDPLPVELGLKPMVLAVMIAIVMWAFLGGHMWILVDAFLHKGWIEIPVLDYLFATAAFGAAWVVGFLIILAPAGVGPREVVLAWALPISEVVLVVAVSRVALTLADGVLAGLAALTGPVALRKPAFGQPQETTSTASPE